MEAPRWDETYFKDDMGIPKELEEAAYVRLWTDTFYSSLFLRKFGLLSVAIGGLGANLVQYIAEISNRTQIPSTAYQQAIISTGTLMNIAPLLIIYLVAQKGFVESLAQTGIKM
jgi:multiple sugar transport system permease protein